MTGTVLIIDSEKHSRLKLYSILGPTNIEVLEASNGLKAVRLFREHQNDIRLIICDPFLKEQNGIVTIKQIRQMDPGIPVIMLCRHAVKEVVIACRQLGIQGFLRKPVDISKLKTLISEYTMYEWTQPIVRDSVFADYGLARYENKLNQLNTLLSELEAG